MHAESGQFVETPVNKSLPPIVVLAVYEASWGESLAVILQASVMVNGIALDVTPPHVAFKYTLVAFGLQSAAVRLRVPSELKTAPVLGALYGE